MNRKKRKMPTVYCMICEKQVSKRYYDNHIMKCKKNKFNEELIIKNTNKIRKLYLDGMDQQDLMKIGFKRGLILKSIIGIRRNRSEYIKLRYKKNPKIAKKHSKFMKKYINKIKPRNPWAIRKQSYAEKLFNNLINNNKLYEKFDIVNEYHINNYFLDFAFVNLKLDVEIDGKQHLYTIEKDKIRDNILKSEDWRICRIPAINIINNFKETEEQFLRYLEKINITPKIFQFNRIISQGELKEIIKNQKKIDNEKLRKIKFEKNIKSLKHKIYNSEIDLTKVGCLDELAKILKMTKQATARFIRKNLPEIKFRTIRNKHIFTGM